jgi:DNA-binding beta-propeller fold protein YncE
MIRHVCGVLLTLAVAAVPAAAQPYVYAVPATGLFRGIHVTSLPARLVTIDPASGEAIASLTLPGCLNAYGVAVRSDGLRVFVACGASGTTGAVFVIDPVAKQVVATRTLPGIAGGIAVTPAGDRLVVLLINAPGGSQVLDATSLTTLGNIAAPVSFGNVHRVVATNTTAYFEQSLRLSGAVIVASLADFTVTTTIDLGVDNVLDIAVTGDGSRLIVVSGNNKVSIVDTATNTVMTTLNAGDPSGFGGFGVAADAGARAYVSGTPGISTIDLPTGTFGTVLPPAGRGVLTINPDGTRLYAAPADATSTVSTIDIQAGTVLASAIVKGGTFDLATSTLSPAIAPDACSYAINLQASSPKPSAGTAPIGSPAGSSNWRVHVTALPDRCSWTTQSDVPWITFEYANGTGPDNVGVTVAPNTSGVQRVGTISIGGQTLTITQAGCSNPIIFFDRPAANATVSQPFPINGWAIDTCAPSGTGIEDPSGTLGYGRARPDVAAAFGSSQFTNSGFEFRNAFEFLPGPQDITVSFRDTVTGTGVNGTTRANVLPSIAPFGSIDTPAEGATVSGDMPLTGWVMDDVGLLGNVLVYRDSLPGEGSSPGTPGKLFVGVPTRVAGARPDVQALFPSYNDNDRAGFGLMVLTNALPNGGNGTFTFHVLVADRYTSIWLGPRTVTVDNAASPLPFGAVDLPAAGATVSGDIFVHGWALTPGSAIIPVDGTTIDVVIDGQVVGHPTYNQARPDVQALFPSYTNSAGPGGYFFLNTRTLSNGLHSIAWVVRDNAGNVRGIGSKYFTVQNQ